jgi:hypothetical protein
MRSPRMDAAAAVMVAGVFVFAVVAIALMVPA